MYKVHIDFETHSAADIKKVGAWLYANHPSTDVMCVAFACGRNPEVNLAYNIEASRPQDTCSLANSKNYTRLKELEALAKGDDVLFIAHNAAFEQAIWSAIMVKKYDFPPIPIHRWRCTMAQAYMHGLPGTLEMCAKALKLPLLKDTEGGRIMLMLATPKKDGTFWTPEEKPDEFEKLYAYCRRDVEVERAIDDCLIDLPPKEQRVWAIDQRMNQEGIQLDTDTIRIAMALNEEHKERTLKGFQQDFNPTQRNKLLEHLRAQGCDVKDTRKGTLAKLKKAPNTPASVLDDLEIVSEVTRTSLAKLPQMLVRSDSAGVMRETLNYHAAHTGRWGGRGVQIQNLMRPVYDMDTVIRAIRLESYECFRLIYPDVATALASSMRGMLVARPGKKFYVADLSQMEARVLAWLAGQQEVLDTFARGDDLYCVAASDIYGRKVTKENKHERQVGKVAVLALGYQGGIGAFAKMAETYQVDLLPAYPALMASASPSEMQECERDYLLYLKRTKEDPVGKEIGFLASIIKQRFRVANDKIQGYWEIVEAAAIRAVVCPGDVADDGSCQWFMHERFLVAKLPDGKCIFYPYPKVETTSTGKQTLTTYQTVKGKWMRIGTYGGRLVENLTQAVQAQMLKDAILRLDAAGYNVLFHVHDEIISEVDENEDTLDHYCATMATVPEWAPGLPVDAKGWEGERYGKE